MPECITLQVGQCGNQIGSRFWHLILQEQAAFATKHSSTSSPTYDEALSSFFRNVDSRKGCAYIPVGDGTGDIRELRARSVLVDMEEGVLGSIAKSPIRELFDPDQIISSQSGSGNNWAVGYHHYGQSHGEQVLESLRRQAEYCDGLQSFFSIHSIGGGTGSGLGSYLGHLLQDNFPKVYRFSSVITPSADDDVVTSPYNSILSLDKLLTTADCVLPMENSKLLDIHRQILSNQYTSTAMKRTIFGNGKEVAFDSINTLAAHLLMNLTSSMRFEGSLNVDINDIVTNLVPFPRFKFLISSMTPLYTLQDMRIPPRRLDQLFSDAFSRESQLIDANPKAGTYLACVVLARGNFTLSDIRRNIDRLRPTLSFVPWNQDGWKTGLCAVPPNGLPHCLLTLANNCSIQDAFIRIHDRFGKLHRRKAMMHHYLANGMEMGDFSCAGDNVAQLIQEYRSLKLNTAR